MTKIIGLLLVSLLVLVKLTQTQQEFNYDFYQKDYHFLPEHIDVVSYNKQYLKQLSVVTFKYNRTTTALNVSVNFNVDTKDQLELIGQAYKFASNEYRLFPLRLSINACKAWNTNMMGIRNAILKCGNLTECTVPKGRLYVSCNLFPDESKMPPYIPTGRYMVEVQGMYLSTEIFVARGYAEITRPIV